MTFRQDQVRENGPTCSLLSSCHFLQSMASRLLKAVVLKRVVFSGARLFGKHHLPSSQLFVPQIAGKL